MNLKRYMLAAAVVVAIFVSGEMLGRLSARSEAQVAPAPAAERTTAQIARERVKIAEDGFMVVSHMQQLGVGDTTGAAAWVLRRAHAASDLPDKTERIAVLEECSKRMSDQIRRFAEMQKLGTASSADVGLAKFDALEIELLLIKARDNH